MKIELSRKEIKEAIQDYVHKKLGDEAYITDFKAVEDNHYVNISVIEANFDS